MTTHGAKELRRWREKNKLTQTELAAELGLSQGAVSHLESDDGDSPSLATAVRIQRLTGIQCEAWLTKRRSA